MQTISDAIRKTPEWQHWIDHQEKHMEFDVHETNETGWMSDEHAEAFLNFVKRI